LVDASVRVVDSWVLGLGGYFTISIFFVVLLPVVSPLRLPEVGRLRVGLPAEGVSLCFEGLVMGGYLLIQPSAL
jgi:hypothetical protein